MSRESTPRGIDIRNDEFHVCPVAFQMACELANKKNSPTNRDSICPALPGPEHDLMNQSFTNAATSYVILHPAILLLKREHTKQHIHMSAWLPGTVNLIQSEFLFS